MAGYLRRLEREQGGSGSSEVGVLEVMRPFADDVLCEDTKYVKASKIKLKGG